VVEQFTESVSFDWRLWPYDIQGSIAHARMLGRQGIITREEARKIIQGLKEIARDIRAGRLAPRAELEDVHMNIEAALVERIGPVGGKLHTARSRNDQVALDLRLYLRDELEGFTALLKGLLQGLLQQAQMHRHTPMPGYTHLQRAQPVLLAHHLLAYGWMFLRDLERLRLLKERLDVLPLGACALAGTSLPIEPRQVAQELGFSRVSENSMDAVSDRDFVVEFLCWASILAMHLSRLAEELVLWSTQEFGFLELPDAFATGSSIMPQKKNPDVAELVRARTARVYGALMGALTMLKALPLSYNRDLQEDKPLLFDAVDTLKASLQVMAQMLPALKFRPERLLQAAQEDYSTATDMAEYLAERGLPFREAHKVVGQAVLKALRAGKPLQALTLKELKALCPLFEQDVYQRLSPQASVRAKRSRGSSSPQEVARQLRALRQALRRKW